MNHFKTIAGPTQAWKATLANACMYSSNTGSKTGVTNMADCQLACEQTSKVCLAVDWNSSTKDCWFNDKDATIQAVKSPCSDNYFYSEYGTGSFLHFLFNDSVAEWLGCQD